MNRCLHPSGTIKSRLSLHLQFVDFINFKFFFVGVYFVLTKVINYIADDPSIYQFSELLYVIAKSPMEIYHRPWKLI